MKNKNTITVLILYIISFISIIFILFCKSEIGLIAVVAFIASTISGTWILGLKIIFPSILFSSNQEKVNILSREIAKSGQELASATCGGKISGLPFSDIWGLKVIAYPKGIWVKPLLIKPFAIKYEEIINVCEKKEGFNNKIEIVHTSKNVKSPIILHISLSHGVSETIILERLYKSQ